MRKDNLIRVENVSKSFRKVQALSDFSLAVSSGTIFSLLGPNGAGKTTLMKILLGLVRSDSGSVTIFDLPVSSPLSRKGVRYLPENVTFPSWATPAILFRQLERIRHESSVEEFRLRCSELECVDLMKRPLGKMSRGQRQRVALSLVTSGRPELVLLDEPSTGLDPGGRILVRNLIGKLASEGATVLINSHLLGEVERVCDTATFISRGRLIAEGKLDSLSRQTGMAYIETDNADKMKLSLEERGYSCRKESKGILAELDDPAAFRDMAHSVLDTGIRFSGINQMRETLEDVFLRIMDSERGNDIVS
ncbi:MAG: ATP-binding cassette domain-containing protein [Candidatus Aegiribacteria sp.]|nr:ATP-binding cassette domain-containing protein [Candidatus Aegiribacteria sp.]